MHHADKLNTHEGFYLLFDVDWRRIQP